MKDPMAYQPSEVELEILQILWEDQPTTVRQVHERIQVKREVGYTTVLTFLQRMAKKGIVERYKEGKTHYYKAVPQEADVQESLFNRLLNTAYKGSAMKMVMHALGNQRISEEELGELQDWINAQKGGDDA